MHQSWIKIAKGAIGGCIATLPMSLVMLTWHRKPWRRYTDPLPPWTITDKSLQAAGADDALPDSSEELLSVANHFAYGATVGAVYGALTPNQQSVTQSVGTGAAYGLAVWAGSYLGWLPAAGLYPPADEDSQEKQAVMVAAHLVWGGCLGLTMALLSRRRPGDAARRRPDSRRQRLAPPPADPQRGLPIGYDQAARPNG